MHIKDNVKQLWCDGKKSTVVDVDVPVSKKIKD